MTTTQLTDRTNRLDPATSKRLVRIARDPNVCGGVWQTAHAATGDPVTHQILHEGDRAVIFLSYHLWWSVPHREMSRDDWDRALAWQRERERSHESILESLIRAGWRREGLECADNVEIEWMNTGADPTVELPGRQRLESGDFTPRRSASMWPRA